MPYYKGTLLFQYTGSQAAGFSESFVFAAADDAAARLNLASWPNERRKWLAQQWKIIGFRLASFTLSDVSGKCKAKFKPLQIGACIPNPLGALGDADNPYVSVLFRFSWDDPDKKPRNFMARGIPDTWWTGGALTIPAADGNKFLAWFNFMKTKQVQGGTGVPGSSPPCDIIPTGLNQYCVVRGASRRIGRPFQLLRGRRRKKKV